MDGFKITQQLVFSCLNFPYFFGFVNYNSFINIEVQPFLKNWYLKSKYFSFSWSSSNAGKGEHFPCRCRRHANTYRVRFCQSYRDLIHVKTEAAKCQTLEWSITGVVFIHCKITIISINQQLAAIHKKAVAGAIDAESLSFHQQSYHTLWTDSSQTMAYHFPKLHPVFFYTSLSRLSHHKDGVLVNHAGGGSGGYLEHVAQYAVKVLHNSVLSSINYRVMRYFYSMDI